MEKFKDPNSVMAVVDFGRLQLRNNLDKPEIITTGPIETVTKENEEDGEPLLKDKFGVLYLFCRNVCYALFNATCE